MPRLVPREFLLAETQSWPITSEAAFAACTTSLDRTRSQLAPATQALANALENHLRLRAGGMSLAVLAQLRDGVWFSRQPTISQRAPGLESTLPLTSYLVRLANRYLQRRGPDVVLLDTADLPTLATEWRWLSFALPPDLMVAALFNNEEQEPTTDHVTLVTPHLQRVLERDVALTHLHVGAAFSFSCLWTMLMRSQATDPPLPADLRRCSSEVPLGGAESFLRLLAAAAVCRLLMARALMGDPSPVPNIARAITPGTQAYRVMAELRQSEQCLRAGSARVSRNEILALYRTLVGPEPNAGSRRKLALRDPLANWLPPRRGLGLCETRFAARAIRYLLAHPEDTAFASLFWQYQRVRAITYRFLVAEPLTTGMDWFQRHYDRIACFRKGLNPQLYRIALELESGDLGLASLEVRTSPPASWHEVRRLVMDLADQARSFHPAEGAPRPEVGLVLHFIKSRSPVRYGRPPADPRHAVYPPRFGPWFAAAWTQAAAVATALDFNPEILLILRGIDVASLELEVPTWALIPLFRRLDIAGRRAAERLARRRPSWKVPTLRHTLHVGEDFRRLVDGIRRMHEPIEFGMIGTGDRFGHGLALGMDPVRWCGVSTSISQPAEERLDDLLWELERYRRGDWSPTPGRLAFVRGQILELGADIYGSDDPQRPPHEHPTELQLTRARRLRHSPRFLQHLDYPRLARRMGPFSDVELDLAYRYLTDPEVFERGQTPVEVSVGAGECEMLQRAQAWLRGVVARLEITIESNPSSNLLVADLDNLNEHPLLRLQEIGSSKAEGQTVMVSINDDDPMSFATRLSDEFAYVYFALLRCGFSSQEALHHVDRMRANGWRSRFTLGATASQDPDVLSDLIAGLDGGSAASCTPSALTPRGRRRA